LGHKEPDKVPLFLLVTMHGAKELGLSIKRYFSDAKYVVKGQLRMRKKFCNDCLIGFMYGAIDYEAWGGEVIFFKDGPPNSGKPIILKKEEIKNLKSPIIEETKCLQKILTIIELLKSESNDEVPVIGVVISPFTLPVMQMGFDKYIELIYEDSELYKILMEVNIKFCIEWANAQFEAGATAVVYYDPVSSPTILQRDKYLKTGFKVAKKTIANLNGPTATHLASGRAIPIIDDLVSTGTLGVGVSALEDLKTLKNSCKNRLTVIGNLNGVEMARWTPKQAEAKVKEAIAKAGPNGGFILSDNHGEIPYQVPENILLAISNAINKWGQYPLDWVK
jgi:uroporphyrinogen decarboxylase